MLPLQNFKDYISQNSLFTGDSKVLLAVSGGRDSVLMVHLFKEAGYHFGIAHCNFNLRADESQRDESFVRMLASTLGIPFHVTHFKTKAYASAHKVSVQMAARDLRYQWFEEIRQAHEYDLLASAQHHDDAIETVLLNLTRGTGIAGLHGILPKRGKLIRPLLFLSRKEIDQLVADHHIDYVEDSSNSTVNYPRNKIRHDVIPHLKQINPNFEETFEHNIRRFAETEMVLKNVIKTLRKELFVEKDHLTFLSKDKIATLTPQRLLLFELLRPFGFSEPVVAGILQSLNKQSGTSFYSETHCIAIDRNDLVLSQKSTEVLPNAFIHAGDQLLNLGDQQLTISYVGQPYFEKTQGKAFVDAGLLIHPLVVRYWQQGDKFMPLGMKTFKKLSDFFIDEKIPLNRKDSIPILINGNGEVIWIAGLREDNRYKVSPTTKRTAIFELKAQITILKQE